VDGIQEQRGGEKSREVKGKGKGKGKGRTIGREARGSMSL